MDEFPSKGAKFILNDLKGLLKKYGKDIRFFDPGEIAFLIRKEMDGTITRKQTREICEKLLRGS